MCFLLKNIIFKKLIFSNQGRSDQIRFGHKNFSESVASEKRSSQDVRMANGSTWPKWSKAYCCQSTASVLGPEDSGQFQLYNGRLPVTDFLQVSIFN